jgi:hypothetical protein
MRPIPAYRDDGGVLDAPKGKSSKVKTKMGIIQITFELYPFLFNF